MITLEELQIPELHRMFALQRQLSTDLHAADLVRSRLVA
jgi:hypothetical protein